MTHKDSKVPHLNLDEQDGMTTRLNINGKKPRTREDFYKFCTFILEYENYGRTRHDEDNRPSNRTPPLDSSGSSVNSESATSSSQEEDKPSGDETDAEQEQQNDNNDDSYNSVTCYCRKPFAGRPMIECSNCLTWVHLSCARIRRSHIPDVFCCALCKHNASTANRSALSSTTTATSTNSTATSTAVNGRTTSSDAPMMKRVKRGVSF